MKQKIEQLSKGIFEYKLPDILLSEEAIRISAAAGSTYHGSFTIRNSKGSRMKGVLYSSSRLFVLSNDKFIEEENRINYKFIADYMDPGEVVNGEISIITECGETTLPFEVKIEPPYCESEIGEIRDLFQFANLAKGNWEEAEQIFCTDSFERMLNYCEPKMVSLYRELVSGTLKSRALEEFLVATRKKLPVVVSVDKEELEYNAGEYSFFDKLVLSRNTWGYVDVRITADAPFLRPEHSIVGMDAFHQNTCEVGFVIEPEKMHAGLNCARICVETVHQKLLIPVICHRKGRENTKAVKQRRKKQYEKKIAKNYLRFRLNKISAGKYAAEAENYILGLANIDTEQSDLQALYHIHLLIAAGKEAQAKVKMAEFESRQTGESRDNPVPAAACLYLAALLKKQAASSDYAVSVIRDAYRRYPEQWMLLWFLLYLDKSYVQSPLRRLEDIRDAFLQGARSPILYYEAAFAVNEAPSMLNTLNLFELQVLHFSVRNQFITKEVVMRLAYLANQVNESSVLLLRLLKSCYKRFREKELLSAICRLLILEERSSASDYFWYESGVREQLGTEKLQEYYILSHPEKTDMLLEHSTLTYFAYACDLPEDKKAYLYANILTNKEAYAFIYSNYESQIREFTMKRLAEGAVDRNLAVLYDAILPGAAVTMEIAAQISNICFYYEIECANPNIAGVCVLHKEMSSVNCVPLSDGKAYIEMYTEDAELLLADAFGNRYLSTVDYTVHKLVHLEPMLELCSELLGDDTKLLLNLAEKAQYYQKQDEASIELQRQVIRIPNLNPECLRDYTKKLIYYYYDNCEDEFMESYLLQIDLRNLLHAERVKIIEFMIIRDLHNVALKAMDEYGFEGIDVKRLFRMCTRLLLNDSNMEKVGILVDACNYVFEAGKYDDTIMKYLVDYYYGTTAQMFEIWKAARTYEIDTLDLEERLLGQMLFSESYISNAKAVFGSYYRSGSNRKLIRAFLSYYAYKYLINDRLVEDELFDVMRREIGYEENEVCLLAVLKWYSSKEQLVDAEVNFVDYHLYRLEQKGITLPFFRDFKGVMRVPQNIYDKYYVEYRTDPARKVVIHYMFEDENAYTHEEMTNVCYGIFVKEFILFSNESLQYYITESSEEGEIVTESTEVRLSPEQTGGEDTKYYQLNLIIAAREMQDEKTALKLMENYIRTDYAITQLFKAL